MSNQQNEAILEQQKERQDEIDIFDADMANTALGQKKRAQTSLVDCQFKADNPGFSDVKELFDDTMAFINKCLPQKN